MEETPRRSINERFTDLADAISEGMGRWWVTALSVLLILVWLATGPLFHWSDTWQLIVNTPTTIFELWIGFLLAAAANRSERRNRELQQHMADMLEGLQHIDLQEDKALADMQLKLDLILAALTPKKPSRKSGKR